MFRNALKLAIIDSNRLGAKPKFLMWFPSNPCKSTEEIEEEDSVYLCYLIEGFLEFRVNNNVE